MSAFFSVRGNSENLDRKDSEIQIARDGEGGMSAQTKMAGHLPGHRENKTV
jgi:hypothetical protein